jgi:hypothetical protein
VPPHRLCVYSAAGSSGRGSNVRLRPWGSTRNLSWLVGAGRNLPQLTEYLHSTSSCNHCPIKLRLTTGGHPPDTAGQPQQVQVQNMYVQIQRLSFINVTLDSPWAPTHSFERIMCRPHGELRASSCTNQWYQLIFLLSMPMVPSRVPSHRTIAWDQ